MMTVEEIDMRGFISGLEGLIEELGIAAPKVVKHELGELIGTLVRVTPPSDPAKTRKSIDKRVDSTLQAANIRAALASKYALNIQGMNNTGPGPSGITWYAVTPDFLFGVAPERDARKDSNDDIYRLFKTMTRRGKQHLSFRHPHKRQMVSLTQKLLVTSSQKTSVKARLKKSIGRLKAGWCASVFNGVIKVSRGIPQYVARHAQGVRGRFNDGTGNKELPYFEIVNSALGVGESAYFVQKALDIRAKAMMVNTQLFFEGKKHLSDYAKRG
jgi:hypothetical protein